MFYKHPSDYLFYYFFAKHSTCIDSRDPSFEQNSSGRVLPVTPHEADDSLTSQTIPGPLTQAQILSAEQFHLVDQNGQPIPYELQSLGDSNAQMVSIFYKEQVLALASVLSG